MSNDAASDAKSPKVPKGKKTIVESVNGTHVNEIGQIREILLGEFISSWEVRISKMETGVKELIGQTEKKLTELESRMVALDKEIKDEIETNFMDLEQENGDLRSLVENFHKELNRKMDSLTDGKLDKESIADVFIQWGQKVKGA